MTEITKRGTMPTYEMVCPACATEFEYKHSDLIGGYIHCPLCEEERHHCKRVQPRTPESSSVQSSKHRVSLMDAFIAAISRGTGR